MTNQSYTANNVTVEFPMGYDSVHSYYEVLKLNLIQMQSNPKRYAKMIEKYEASIELCEKAGL